MFSITTQYVAEDSSKIINLLFLQLNKPNSLSLSSYILCSSTLANLVALHGAIPCLFVLYWNGSEPDVVLQMQTHKRQAEGNNHFASSTDHAVVNACSFFSLYIYLFCK